jgi:hypothetical protein
MTFIEVFYIAKILTIVAFRINIKETSHPDLQHLFKQSCAADAAFRAVQLK